MIFLLIGDYLPSPVGTGEGEEDQIHFIGCNVSRGCVSVDLEGMSPHWWVMQTLDVPLKRLLGVPDHKVPIKAEDHIQE